MRLWTTYQKLKILLKNQANKTCFIPKSFFLPNFA